MTSDREVELLLDAIELAEYPLLAWGITNGSLSDGELRELILKNLPNCDVDALRAELLARGLIFETPSQTYRSRIAELLRLTLSLRQWFPGTKSESAQLLIHDVKFQLRPRSFPRRNLARSQVVKDLSGSEIDSDFIESGLPESISNFQFRSIQMISTAMYQKQNASFVISSGTGSGKTNAYFIPMFNWLGSELKTYGHVGVRTLALYPRKELLKDQLNTALGEARKINQVLKKMSRPTIRIGVWYDETPTNIGAFSKGYARNWVKQTVSGQNAWSCPFLRCQVCSDQPDLIVFQKDMSKEGFEFKCPRTECSFAVSSDELVWTRDKIEGANTSCDVLFTTTESINRQLGTKNGSRAFGLFEDSKLRSILVDEAHIYDGLTGAQHAFLFRRLRYRVKHPLVWVSLSATIENPAEFIHDLIGLDPLVIEPDIDEFEFKGADYVVAVRHYLESKKSPLSSAIQLAMLMSRMLDPYDRTARSRGQFGSKLFVFGDKHDVVNRLYFSLADAEGFDVFGNTRNKRTPSSLATLRSGAQQGLLPGYRETPLSRYDSGQWWKASEELGHAFLAGSSKKIGLTSSQQAGVQKNMDVIVSTSSLEVGFDDVNVGAVLQYKTPPSPASFLQRKGRAGRTQKMRPITAIVLSPFGIDRATWTNAENRLFVPRLPARRLPMSNRYTQKMQGTYVLLDWLNSHAGASKSWHLLSGRYFTKAESAHPIQALTKLLNDDVAREEFTNHLSQALAIDVSEAEQVLWSMPRGILSTVVPTAIRRLESSFAEDAIQDTSPLKEFISSNLFTELHIPEVEVIFPTNEKRDPESLPIQRVLREFIPGNISRHFKNRYWVPITTGDDLVDVVVRYCAIDTGFSIKTQGAEYSMYRPTKLILEQSPYNLNDSSSTFGNWGTLITPLGVPLFRKTGIICWGGQSIELEAFLHSRGTYVNTKRYLESTQGWISPKKGDPYRVESKFIAGEERVVLGFDLDVDAIHFELKRPQHHPPVTSNERTARLMYLLKNDKRLTSKTNIFELERVARSIIQMLLNFGGISQVIALSDEEFQLQLCEVSKLVLLDEVSNPSENLQWLGVEEVSCVRELISSIYTDRDSNWKLWLDERILATLGTLILDAFRTIIPDLDFDDLIIDVLPSNSDPSAISVWISEVSAGGNGSIERIVAETNTDSKLEMFVEALLKPREFESLDADIRKLNEFSLTNGLEISNEVRSAWTKNLQDVESSLLTFQRRLDGCMIYPSRSAISVFVNRLLGPGSDARLVKLVRSISNKWDADEERIGLEIPPEVVGLLWKDDQSIDEILHLDNPSPARRAVAVSSLMWTRPTQGLELDYEVANPFKYGMTLDVLALRSLIGFNDSGGNFRVERESTIANELETQSLESPTVAIVTGDSHKIRRALIKATVEPIEDDALLIFPRATEVSVIDNKFQVKLASDFGVL